MTASVSTTTTLRRRRGLTEEAATAAVDTACRRLRLPTIRAVVEEAVAAATGSLAGATAPAAPAAPARGVIENVAWPL